MTTTNNNRSHRQNMTSIYLIDKLLLKRRIFKESEPCKNTGLNIYKLIYELPKFMETDQSAVIFLIILNQGLMYFFYLTKF